MYLRRPAIRWTSQELAKPATVAQLAASRAGNLSFGSTEARIPVVFQKLAKVAAVAQSPPPPGKRDV